jgi:hypothetical protein
VGASAEVNHLLFGPHEPKPWLMALIVSVAAVAVFHYVELVIHVVRSLRDKEPDEET